MQKQNNIATLLLFICAGLIVIASLIVYLLNQHPTNRFKRAVASYGKQPNNHIEKQTGFSTYILDQPLLGKSITSKDVNQYTVWAYEKLVGQLEPKPMTYYCEIASMPTQETIWQYPECFVRLYVTSSLDSDGVSVGVFSGAYLDFRQVNENAHGVDRPDLYTHFAPIEFSPPSRFLANR